MFSSKRFTSYIKHSRPLYHTCNAFSCMCFINVRDTGFSSHSPPPSGLFSDRLYIKYHAYLITYTYSLDYLSLQQLRYYVLNYVYPNPPCQLSLWEETRAPGENHDFQPRALTQNAESKHKIDDVVFMQY